MIKNGYNILRYIVLFIWFRSPHVDAQNPVENMMWHINYLETFQTSVKAAIVNGMSLKATVKSVAMPEFSGYALI